VSDLPETRYARSGDVNIAYQVAGDGPFDLVWVPGYVTHLELAWKLPNFGQSLWETASFSRLIKFDKRGTGMSDPVSGAPTLETRMDDVRAVMDAAGSRRAALFGVSDGASMSVLFAATYPERTAALVLRSAAARTLWAPDYPWGSTEDDYRRRVEIVEFDKKLPTRAPIQDFHILYSFPVPATPGVYTVTVTVSDAAGRRSVTTQPVEFRVAGP